MSENIITDFSVAIYGVLEKYTETISKGRCRIFYKYGNRNGTYITDEFAEKLLASIPYTPVKGIYNEEEGDYEDHGKKRSEGRIYGIVPANPNFAWEEHEDDDGVTRTYACVDVLIYTALYAEAHDIIGKPQSMELYVPSLKGDWKIINGKKYYVFTEGCFLGLQALGDCVEPCFEGAAFFSLYEDLKKMVQQIEEYQLRSQDGGRKMLNFKLSDREKHDALWTLLNPNYNEENDWAIECCICEVYDEYCVVRNYSQNIFERVYYTKNDETDSIELGERERCYFMDVSESEKQSLEKLQEKNNGSFEKIDENYSALESSLSERTEELAAKTAELEEAVANHTAEISENHTKIDELNDSISTLTTERDAANHSLEELRESNSQLEQQVVALNSYKDAINKKEKQAIIAKYEKLISADVLNQYSLNIDEYADAVALDKDLAYELVSSNGAVFSAMDKAPAYIPKDSSMSGLESILEKYKR